MKDSFRILLSKIVCGMRLVMSRHGFFWKLFNGMYAKGHQILGFVKVRTQRIIDPAFIGTPA